MTWRGQELAKITRHEPEHGPVQWRYGSRRKYQTRLGAGHFGLVGGPGVLLIGVAEGLRGALGENRDWWLFELLAGTGGLLLLLSVVYVIWYFFPGVPDGLRPPCQRGWEIVDGELQLVRPEAFHEHPKHRSAAESDEAPRGYDPWR